MKKVLFVILLVPTFLSAQINESDTLNVQARLALTGFRQTGNIETLIFRVKSDLSLKPFKKWVFKTQNAYAYQEFGKKKADEDIISLNFIYFNPERKIYPLVLGFATSNFRREIDVRYLAGTGVTFQVLTRENDWLKLSVSSELERTDFGRAQFNIAEYNGNEIVNTVRGTIWANGKYNLFDKRLILYHELYFQPSVEQINNYRWFADVALELPLRKYLNFKINYVHTYESLVIENQKQEDTTLTFGFTLKSY